MMELADLVRGEALGRAIERNAAVACRRERRKLVLPHAAMARGRMQENDGRSLSPGVVQIHA